MTSSRPAPDRFSCLGLLTYPVGLAEDLVHSRCSNATGILPSEEVDVLSACEEFRTLDEHASALARQGLGGGGVRAMLTRLVGSGFLVSRRNLLGGASAVASADPVCVRTIGIVTCDRPDGLERCAAGYAENARAFGRSPRLVVMDDSRQFGDRNREILRRLSQRFGLEVWYAGAAEKEAFRTRLAREGAADADLLEFALADPEDLKYAVGANRNALLLEAAGEPFVTLDDDTLARVAPAPDPDPLDLRLTTRADPTEFWFHPDRDSARGAVRFEDRDLLALHETLLGRDVSACVSGVSEERVDLEGNGADLFLGLRAGKGRVRLTMPGVVGDSGMASNSGFLSAQGPTHERLVASEAAYRAACAGRNVVRAVRCPTLGSRTLFMTYAAGIDHRDPLPPFVPVLRNQDGMFAFTLRAVSPSAAIGYLPWVVLHDPQDSRAMSRDVAGGVYRQVAWYQVFRSCAASLQLGAMTPEGPRRFAALGRHLREIGALPRREFEEIVRKMAWMQASSELERLESFVEERGGRPAYWVEDVHRASEQLRGALIREDYCIPRDLCRTRSPEEAAALSPRLVARTGALLEAWSDIVAATRRLAPGERLARKL